MKNATATRTVTKVKGVEALALSKFKMGKDE